jgi:hypothetical protein
METRQEEPKPFQLMGRTRELLTARSAEPSSLPQTVPPVKNTLASTPSFSQPGKSSERMTA